MSNKDIDYSELANEYEKNKKKKVENVFNDYKDKVNYDYIIKAKAKIEFVGSEDQGQLFRAMEHYEEEIENLIGNEDYNKTELESLDSYMIYPGLDNLDDTLDITFGICLDDVENIPSEEDLIEDIKEYMHVIDSNTDGIHVAGWGGAVDSRDDIEPAYITIEICPKDQMEIEVLKRPNNNIDIELEGVDKLLVTEGTIRFKKLDETISFVLTDDGMVQKLVTDKTLNESIVFESKPFSKLSLEKDCKLVVKEGFKLVKEAEIKTTDGDVIDTEVEKDNIEQAKQEVDELQKAKEELNNAVDKLMNESQEIDIMDQFPSTEFTSKELDLSEIDTMDLETNLTEEQKTFLESIGIDVETLQESLKFVLEFIDLADISTLSIDTYIRQLLSEINKEESNEQ